MNKLDDFLFYEQNRLADNEFFDKFNKNDYKAKNPLDDFIRINTQNKFDKQSRIENVLKMQLIMQLS